MKKFLWLFLMGCALPAFPDTISTVSFNPARTLYSWGHTVKVTREANLRGGLQADMLVIESGGKVKMQNDATPNRYDILGPIQMASSTAKLNMPKMIFRGSRDFNATPSSPLGYTLFDSAGNWSNTYPPNPIDMVYSYGGSMTFNDDSFVQTIRVEQHNSTLFPDALKAKLNLFVGTLLIPKGTGSKPNGYLQVSEEVQLAGYKITARSTGMKDCSNCKTRWTKVEFGEGISERVLEFYGCSCS